MNERIGIIGFGNMGSTIALQLKNDYRILVFDKDIGKTNGLTDITVAKESLELVAKADIVLLAIKPQDFAGILDEIKEVIADKLIISIAAGISTGFIEKALGAVRIVRAMPNISAKVGEGTTCLAKGAFATLSDIDFAENIFDYMGETIVIEEGLMNAATAISGSGPGYCYDLMLTGHIDTANMEEVKKFVKENFVPRLAAAARSIGFSADEAEFLSVTTGNGCIGLLKKTKFTCVELIKQIASKAGTTEAALEVLHKGGSLDEAVKAALARAEQLSNKE